MSRLQWTGDELARIFAKSGGKAYNPDQPRIPEGQSGGGQWSSGSGNAPGQATAVYDKTNEYGQRRTIYQAGPGEQFPSEFTSPTRAVSVLLPPDGRSLYAGSFPLVHAQMVDMLGDTPNYDKYSRGTIYTFAGKPPSLELNTDYAGVWHVRGRLPEQEALMAMDDAAAKRFYGLTSRMVGAGYPRSMPVQWLTKYGGRHDGHVIETTLGEMADGKYKSYDGIPGVGEKADKPPRWQWQPNVRRYRDLNSGRFVSSRQIRIWTQQSIDASTDRAVALGHALAADQITLEQWHQGFRDLVKKEIVKQYLAGRGGEQALTPAERGRISAVCRDQWKYMDRFAAQIANQECTEAEIIRRMKMYVNSAKEAYERASRIAAKEAEFDEVSWVMDRAKENCTGEPGCIQLAARGWQKAEPWPYRIGGKDAYPCSGSTPCLTNCGCTNQYRKSKVVPA